MLRTVPLWAAVALAAVAAPARADDAEVKKTVAGLVAKMQAATVKGDVAAIIDLTHPKVVQQLGGREKAIAATKGIMEEMKAKGLAIKSFKAGKPSDPVRRGDEVFVLVPTEMEMTAAQGSIVGTSYLLGFSADGGKTWKFVDGASGPAETRKLFPDLPEKLVLPKPEFKFIKD